MPSDCTPLTSADFEGDVDLPAGCYQVDFALAKSSDSVTLQPGVEMYFAEQAGLTFSGAVQLRAVGSADAPIVMEGLAEGSGSWRGVALTGLSSTGNDMEFVEIRDAGSSGAALSVQASQLDVSNATMEANAGYAISADETSRLSLAASTLTGNERLLELPVDGLDSITGDNALSGNDEDIVFAVGSSVSTDATWKITDVPIHPQTDVLVSAALNLSAGVTVAMGQDRRLDVTETGTLTAEGTADAPITITGQTAEDGFWQGVAIRSNSADNVLSNVRVEYGGGGDWTGASQSAGMIYVDDSGKLTVRDSVLANSALHALLTAIGADIEGFSGNRIEANARTVLVYADAVRFIDPSNAFTDNAEQFVRVGQANTNNFLTTAQTWRALDVPYRFMFRASIRAPLTVAEGTVLQFSQDHWIEVQQEGTLTVEGTEQAPVIFEGAESLPGYWGGVNVQTSSANNVLQNATVRDAGRQWTGGSDSIAAVFVGGAQGDASLELVDSTLTGNEGNGVHVQYDSSVSCSGTSITVEAPYEVASGTGSSTCM